MAVDLLKVCRLAMQTKSAETSMDDHEDHLEVESPVSLSVERALHTWSGQAAGSVECSRT